MEEFNDILDYFADAAFQVGSEAPTTPLYPLREILRSRVVGELIAQAMIYYLMEQDNHGVLDGSDDVCAHEVVSKFEKLYNLGVFLFEVTLKDPVKAQDNFQVDLFVWDSGKYININESVNNYLLETENLKENVQNGENDEI